MIARLEGTVVSLGDEQLVLNVGGVGYAVHCSARTLGALGRPGDAAAVEVETRFREGAIELFGFGSTEERDLFRILNGVQGVGGRVALSLLGLGAPAQLADAVARGDKRWVSRADGVGPKLATRIVNELKDKLAARALGAPPVGGVGTSPAARPPLGPATARGEAVSALINLGYRADEAEAAVATAIAAQGPDTAVEQLLPAALRALAPT